MKIYKRLSALAAALLLCCASAGNVYAHEVPDLSKTGSISAAMVYDGEPVSGGSLTLYRVGDVAEDDGNYGFALAEDFAGSELSLENIEDPGLASSLAAHVEKEKISGNTVSVEADGTVTASGLELGLYLVVQNSAAEGFEAISPFLVSVPMYENGAYQYQVNVEPKMSALTPAEPTPGSSVTPEPSQSPASPTKTPAPTKAPTTSASSGNILPQTGQLNWPVPVLTIAGLCLLFVGWGLRFGGQRKVYGA